MGVLYCTAGYGDGDTVPEMMSIAEQLHHNRITPHLRESHGWRGNAPAAIKQHVIFNLETIAGVLNFPPYHPPSPTC